MPELFEEWYPPLKAAEDHRETAVEAAAAHFVGIQLSPPQLIELADMVIARHNLIRRIVETLNRAGAHRYDFTEHPCTPEGDPPAGGPDNFYNGVRYVVSRMRATMLTTPSLLAAEHGHPVTFTQLEASEDNRNGRILDAVHDALSTPLLSPEDKIAVALNAMRENYGQPE